MVAGMAVEFLTDGSKEYEYILVELESKKERELTWSKAETNYKLNPLMARLSSSYFGEYIDVIGRLGPYRERL